MVKAAKWTPSAIQAYVTKNGTYPPGIPDPRTAVTIKQGAYKVGRYSIVNGREA